MLTNNDTAPLFTLPNQDNKLVSLKDLMGKWVLVYFYPKDDTPGCTIEACILKDNLPSFEKSNAVILGISTDSIQSHKKFHTKYFLNFDLLSDTNKEIVHAYGVWQEKKFMGKTYMGIARTSFLINPQGKIEKIYSNVKPVLHAKEVASDLAHLTTGNH